MKEKSDFYFVYILQMERLTNYEPHTDTAKSFYGKAQELLKDNGDRVLFSYGTPVLKITANDRLYYTKTALYSHTTSRHARDFVRHYLKFYLDDRKYTTAQFLEINGEEIESI